MICVPPPPLKRTRGPARLALYTPSRWDERRVLRVRFMDGEPEIRDRVRAIEAGPEGWSSASAMQFVFTDDPAAEIRVTFAKGASWSYLGTGALGLPQDMPTMQLGWAYSSDDTELRRVWLHEAGHALGFNHEHQTQLALDSLPWDWDGFRRWHEERGMDVQAALDTWRGVTAAEVLEQPFYDRESIMSYYMPGEWFIDGVARGGTNKLSASDRMMVMRWYGPPAETWLTVYAPFVWG